MKKLLLPLLVMTFVACFATVSLAASIVGSDHDFSISTGPPPYNTFSGDRICIACHTPHNADVSEPDAPLWNHMVTRTTFTLYAGTGTLDATDLGQPDGSSRLCLSCHDGTVALDSFGGATGGTHLDAGATSMLGIGMENDHPISFTYDAALVAADGALERPTDAGGGQYEVIGTTNGTGITLPLFNSKLQCASCHVVHDPAFIPFLRGSNAGSALCLTCHLK